jgi:hypothetical protein
MEVGAWSSRTEPKLKTMELDRFCKYGAAVIEPLVSLAVKQAKSSE